MRILASEADVAEGVAFLAKADPRLRPVIEIAGPVPLRRRGHGFEGLARIVVGQQLSVASAEAIWTRVAAGGHVSPQAIAAASDADLRAAGLSAAKVRTLRAVSDACLAGLDIAGLGRRPPEEAIAELVAIRGIGPWTATIYLLFCLGHADAFPEGDLALQTAVGMGLGLPDRPRAAELGVIAEAWSPWRGVAACLFWAYYRAVKSRQGVPV